MLPIHALFEGHLTVSNLPRAMSFYGKALGLELAQFVPEQRVAFYWIGGHGTSMLGL
ncbi:MAG TPA: VOC family protein [Candidatus Angelobacter sp.]|nr:VOC family protein [Candidatus Angelobacter sp.]